MDLFTQPERRFAGLVGELAYCNPFVPQRIELERAALGNEFDSHLADWNVRAGAEFDHPNLVRLVQRASQLLQAARSRFAEGRAAIDDRSAELYEHLALFVVYHDFRPALDALVADRSGASAKGAALYRKVLAEAQRWFGASPRFARQLDQMPHIFAGFFQLRRAFGNIFLFIVGSSRATVNLRAAVWESIFTHDMRRYRRLLFDRMGDYATLITGPSGTGKELVARAIGLSRYIPFDAEAGKFAERAEGSFFPISLAAMSPTLIESELFGHARGAFTGAIAERMGWLESCPPSGTVFLDEVGELEPAIQVKLLRVLQAREFSRLGETARRVFTGKIVAATNRSLADEMLAGRFRHDLYYRLCSDVVEMPSLRARLDEDPAELLELATHLAQRLVGSEAAEVALEVERVVLAELGDGYAWPGNVRELEQCVRNVLVRRRYQPLRSSAPAPVAGSAERLASEMFEGALTADEVVRQYCRIIYDRTGSYEATARRLGLDRRTVKAKILASNADSKAG